MEAVHFNFTETI